MWPRAESCQGNYMILSTMNGLPGYAVGIT
jgi:hypothetical protein